MNTIGILHEITHLSEQDCFHIEERIKPEFNYPLHKHIECEINYVENAAGAKRTIGDSVEVIDKYDLVLITGNELEHVWENHDCKSHHIREITIHFSSELISQGVMNKFQFKSIKVMLEQAQKGIAFSQKTILQILPLLNSLAQEKQGFDAVITFFQLLHKLSISNDIKILSSSSFARIKLPSDSRRIQKTQEYIQQNYMKEIRLSTLADMVGMSEVAFSRFFKLRTGTSVMEYLLDIRIGYVTRLLVYSTQSILEICYNCGFNNVSNFNRIFRNKKGCTPKEFRESYNSKKIII
jgi:AraC-type DNA-binding domain-containing proteins